MLMHFYKLVLLVFLATEKYKTLDRNNVTFIFWSFKIKEAQSGELFCTKFV